MSCCGSCAVGNPCCSTRPAGDVADDQPLPDNYVFTEDATAPALDTTTTASNYHPVFMVTDAQRALLQPAQSVSTDQSLSARISALPTWQKWAIGAGGVAAVGLTAYGITRAMRKRR